MISGGHSIGAENRSRTAIKELVLLLDVFLNFLGQPLLHLEKAVQLLLIFQNSLFILV